MEYTNIFESALPSYSHSNRGAYGSSSDPYNDNDTRGAATTEKTHRKIELQSPADLTYLIANVSRAAREKIDRDLPPESSVATSTQNSGVTNGGANGHAATSENAVGAGEDAMRVRVEGLVDDLTALREMQYIRSTFRAAKDNLCINGMDSAELDAELAKAEEGEEIEPFNEKLKHRIQALSAQIEAQTLALANLRRSAPSSTAKQFHDSFTKAAEADDQRLQALETESLQMAQGTKIDVGEVERLDEIKRTWEVGTERLGELSEDMAPTLARMDKAKKAVDVVQE